MANNPSNFPFLVGGLPDQPQEIAGGLDAFPGPPNDPLVTAPKIRYWPLFDSNTRAIRMWRSADSGKTWAQFDSLNAPIIPADGTGPSVKKIWEYFNSVWDGADTIYVVGWHPTFVVALFPFKISTNTWQPAIVSTLTYLDQTTVRVSGVGGFAVCFRPSDGAVWMAFQAGGRDATDICTLWGAKCIPGGAGWDGALTRLAGTYQDGLFHIVGSMALDPATNKIHLLYQRTIFGANGTYSVTTLGGFITASSVVTFGAGYPFPSITVSGAVWNTTGNNITGGAVTSLGGTLAPGSASGNPDGTVVTPVPAINGNGSLVHRVINTDDSLTAEQTAVNLNENSISNALSPLRIAESRMSFTFTNPQGTFSAGGLRKVARSLIGDAPVWEVTTPAAANGVGDLTGVFPQPMNVVRQLGVDYLVFGFADNSGFDNAVFQFVSSPDIGAPWSAVGTFIAFGDNSGGVTFYGANVIGVVGAPVGTLAFGMFAGTNNGQGYFEFAVPRCQVGIMKGVGVLIKDWQGKAYMNDFVPAELIFGFDNSQTPGLVYPEIYIPKNQALYLDVAPFGPINGLLTLTFKGKKVYE
jgi:hypothetical protein